MNLRRPSCSKKNISEIRKKCSKMKQAIIVAGKKLKSNNADSERLMHERDCLIREKDKWEAERSALIQERDVLVQERLVYEKEQKVNSISAPRSPR